MLNKTFEDLENAPAVRRFYDVGDQLKHHVYSRSLEAFAKGDAKRDSIRTLSALVAHQKAARRVFLASMGGVPANGDSLGVQSTGVVKGRGFRIEKVIFESRPKTYVTASLYLADRLPGPTGAVLFLCGHNSHAKHWLEYQAACQTLVHAGLVVLALDPIGQGERLSYAEQEGRRRGIRWGTGEHDYVGAQCLPLGDTLTRYFLHDAMRGVDFLISRPEVDPQKIGVTGNSGGGTQTSMLMLADARVAAAAPATFIMSRESFLRTSMAPDAEQIWPGFTAVGYDHEDILLAMCPKPVRVLAVQSDFFPIEGTRKTVQRCRRFWKLADQPRNLDLVEDVGVHRFTPLLARAAAEFFAKHLLGKPKIPAADIVLYPPESLWCTQSGQVKDEFPLARAVHEENVERLSHCVALQSSKTSGLKWLRKRVFRHRKKCSLQPRFVPDVRVGSLDTEWAFWWSQPGLLNQAVLFRPWQKAKGNLPVVLSVWDGGTKNLSAHGHWITTRCRERKAVLVLDVSGTGALLPNAITLYPVQQFHGTIQKLADDLLWLDDDLASLRVYDVIRALDVIQGWPGLDASDITAFAHGRHGLYVQLAVALDSRIRALVVKGGIGSYQSLVSSKYYDCEDIKSVLIRGVLKRFDLPGLV